MGKSESLPESPEKEASKPSDEPKRQLKKGIYRNCFSTFEIKVIM